MNARFVGLVLRHHVGQKANVFDNICVYNGNFKFTGFKLMISTSFSLSASVLPIWKLLLLSILTGKIHDFSRERMKT